MYRLKANQEGFQVCAEGPFEYQKFLPGQLYVKIPPEEAGRFEEVPAADGGEA